jgi:hypothetical protein
MGEFARKGTLGLVSAVAVLLVSTTTPAVAAGPSVSNLAVSWRLISAAQWQPSCPLTGSWTLVAADKELPDGTRTQDYGTAPAGRLLIDAKCRYSLQIFKRERPSFASEDKAKGTDAEFKEAVLGSSTHFGSIEADAGTGVLVFKIEDSSFPNWRGTEQRRTYRLAGDLLTYRVPRRPDGSIPISVWRRLK